MNKINDDKISTTEDITNTQNKVIFVKENNKTDIDDTIILFHKKENIFKKFPADKALFEIYYLKCRIPTDTELKTHNIKTTSIDIKKKLSSFITHIPLYDAFTFNIYIIQKRNVYIRIIDHDYRFPDEQIIDFIKNTRDTKMKKLKKKSAFEKDKVFMRSIRKADLMIEFINQFDAPTLYNNYLNIFFAYAPEIGNATFTCVKKSFIPHKNHLKPYYTRDEIIKLGMNMGIINVPKNMLYVDFKDALTRKDYQNICLQIQMNDISAKILIQHQNYIVENNMVGLIQYYTIQGSYFMNQYMRGFTRYAYRNDYLENNIKKMWRLVLNSPVFDNDYILYRFVSKDDYLKHLEIGDIYIENGFISTTRDPFYRNDLYKFGFVLIKIRIPKNVIGVGLCLETFSYFPSEEEIILPPMSHLKLISKNEQCEYYNPDENYAANIKTRYEFEWVKNGPIDFPKRIEYTEQTELVDFLTINKTKSVSVKEKINYIVKKYFDPMNRIRCKIGNEIFYVVAEWYDSTGPYEPMYALKTSEGFSLYSIYEGYVLFMIEIGEENNYGQIRVNYYTYTKYSQLNRQEIMGDDNFIKFISSIAYCFDIPNVIIYADFMSCDRINKNINKNKNINAMQGGNLFNKCNKLNTYNIPAYPDKYVSPYPKKQRNFGNFGPNKAKIPFGPNSADTDIDIDDIDNVNAIHGIDEANKINNVDGEVDTELYAGGGYCVDFYMYLKYGVKRYQNTMTLNVELQPSFSYHDLDLLKTTTPINILKKEDRDEVYQIYTKNYKFDMNIDDKKKDTIADFYIWMIENKCYLMDILVNKIDKLYRNDNPFKKGVYRLDAIGYLYNRRYVNTYNRFIKMSFNEEYQLLLLPKNDYRIRR